MPESISLDTPLRPLRIIAVTGMLILIGGAMGALTTALALLVLAITHDGLSSTVFEFIGFAAVIGAAIGAVIAPLEAWLLLRRVPLWRAIAETALGTLVGAVVLRFVAGGPLYGALLGFTLAAVRLRVFPPATNIAEGSLPLVGGAEDSTDADG